MGKYTGLVKETKIGESFSYHSVSHTPQPLKDKSWSGRTDSGRMYGVGVVG
jgi:hypothetical protein